MAEQIPHDDLFEGPSMTFGEHLEELRVSLFKSVIGIVVGVLIGLMIANHVVRFFQSPLEKAMRNYYLQTALKEMKEDTDDFPNGVSPELEEMILIRQLMPEKVPVDVGQFLHALNAEFPEAIPGQRISSYVYTADDFADFKYKPHVAVPARLKGLCEKLAGGKKLPQTPAGVAWNLLGEEDRNRLAALADQATWQPADALAFYQILNRLIEDPQLHQAPEISHKKLAPRPEVPTLPPPTTPESNTPSEVEAAKKAAETKPADTQAAEKTSDDKEPPLGPGTPLDQTRQRNKRALAASFPEYLNRPAISTIRIWQWKPVRIKFQVLSAEESFMIWMKAGVVAGIALASPWIFYQIWLFVAAGLYRHEKSYIYIYLPFSIALFVAGASLAFFFVFEPVLSFLFSFQSEMNADFEPRIGEWMSFVLILPLGFGISFQLPLVMLFLNRIGLVDITFYITNWRIAILIIFIVAMVLTPADPVSMLLMAIPLCFLYVLGIGLCKWMPRGRSPFEAAYEP
jgi:sec-independent protein translocase protein TatC